MGQAKITRRAGTLVKNIENAEVKLDFTSLVYDTQEHAPKIQSVMFDGQELVNLRDYYAVITPQTDAGSYEVLVNGVGSYGGLKRVPWTIEKAKGSIRVEPAQVTIQGAEGTTQTVNIIYEGDGDITVSESQYVTSRVINIDPVFSKNSWDVIARICATGTVPESWKIGDTKPFNVTGVDEGEYEAQIIGKNHDDIDPTDPIYGDSSYNGGMNKAAITLQFQKCLKNAYAMHSSNNNSVSWENCDMRLNKMPQLLSSIDPELAAVLRTVTKKAPQSYSNKQLISTADKLFLLGPHEVLESPEYADFEAEGELYQYYAEGNSTIKTNINGAVNPWALRCPATNSNQTFCRIGSDGRSAAGFSSGICLVSAAFCI